MDISNFNTGIKQTSGESYEGKKTFRNLLTGQGAVVGNQNAADSTKKADVGKKVLPVVSPIKRPKPTDTTQAPLIDLQKVQGAISVMACLPLFWGKHYVKHHQLFRSAEVPAPQGAGLIDNAVSHVLVAVGAEMDMMIRYSDQFHFLLPAWAYGADGIPVNAACSLSIGFTHPYDSTDSAFYYGKYRCLLGWQGASVNPSSYTYSDQVPGIYTYQPSCMRMFWYTLTDGVTTSWSRYSDRMFSAWCWHWYLDDLWRVFNDVAPSIFYHHLPPPQILTWKDRRLKIVTPNLTAVYNAMSSAQKLAISTAQQTKITVKSGLGLATTPTAWALGDFNRSYLILPPNWTSSTLNPLLLQNFPAFRNMGHIDAVANESALNEMGGYVSKYPGMLTSSFSIFRYNDDPADVDMVGFVFNTETWFVSIIADLVRRAGLPAPFGCDTPGPPFGLGPDPYNERPVTRTWRESTFSDARYYLNLIFKEQISIRDAIQQVCEAVGVHCFIQDDRFKIQKILTDPVTPDADHTITEDEMVWDINAPDPVNSPQYFKGFWYSFEEDQFVEDVYQVPAVAAPYQVPGVAEVYSEGKLLRKEITIGRDLQQGATTLIKKEVDMPWFRDELSALKRLVEIVQTESSSPITGNFITSLAFFKWRAGDIVKMDLTTELGVSLIVKITKRTVGDNTIIFEWSEIVSPSGYIPTSSIKQIGSSASMPQSGAYLYTLPNSTRYPRTGIPPASNIIAFITPTSALTSYLAANPYGVRLNLFQKGTMSAKEKDPTGMIIFLSGRREYRDEPNHFIDYGSGNYVTVTAFDVDGNFQYAGQWIKGNRDERFKLVSSDTWIPWKDLGSIDQIEKRFSTKGTLAAALTTTGRQKTTVAETSLVIDLTGYDYAFPATPVSSYLIRLGSLTSTTTYEYIYAKGMSLVTPSHLKFIGFERGFFGTAIQAWGIGTPMLVMRLYPTTGTENWFGFDVLYNTLSYDAIVNAASLPADKLVKLQCSDSFGRITSGQGPEITIIDPPTLPLDYPMQVGTVRARRVGTTVDISWSPVSLRLELDGAGVQQADVVGGGTRCIYRDNSPTYPWIKETGEFFRGYAQYGGGAPYTYIGLGGTPGGPESTENTKLTVTTPDPVTISIASGIGAYLNSSKIFVCCGAADGYYVDGILIPGL